MDKNSTKALEEELIILKKELDRAQNVISSLKTVISANIQALNNPTSVTCKSKSITFILPYDDSVIINLNGSDLSILTPIFSCILFSLERHKEFYKRFRELLSKRVTVIDLDTILGGIDDFRYETFLIRRENDDSISF